jgi:ATP-dependent Clp protease ATP-binding subunit ClpB
MTSNIGSQYIMDVADEETMRQRVMDALRQHFRPEFLNRVDETVIFHRLEKSHLRQIAEIQLERVAELLANRNITIDLSRDAADRLIEEGYDPVYGARPLKRVLQRRIVDPLALQLIQGQVRDGDHVTEWLIEAGAKQRMGNWCLIING